jgi:hypothetical protein
VVTTGAPAAVALIPDRSTILADGRDLSIVTVAVVDSAGRVVPTATNLVNFTISGGAIIGVGNGNPTSHEADKGSNQRMVFNGFAQVIVQSTNQPGSITLTATATGLTSTNITITEAASLPAPAAPTGVAAALGNSQVVVSWDVVPGATTYNLWRATTSGGPYSIMATNFGSLGYTDSNVTNLTTYYYVVTANGNGSSVNSAEVSATPAVIVTGLTATAGSGQIVLNWTGSAGANYNVKRSVVSGSSYSIIASSIATTNYTDTNVATCQPYFYVVTVTNAGNESLPSGEASASLSGGALSSPWLNTDVGSVGVAGSATYCGSSGQFTIAGSGADIWNSADAFQFVYVYVPVSTNCDIRARVASVQNTSGNAKAAVMIRDSLNSNSRMVLADVEPTAGIEFIWRSTAGATPASSSVAGTAPNWVRLTRTNNTFRAYWSANGISWTQIGASTNFTMATAAYVGLAVCAHNNAVLCTSVVDNVSASFLAANTAPTLAAISSQTVNVGQTVAFTATATDTDQPPQTLTFSLLNGPGTLNASSGAFSWRPAVSNANTVNPVSLMVADNGTPSLSATQSFTITVNPLTQPTASSIVLNGGYFGFQINGQTGPDYAVQVSSNLFNWSTLLITNSPAMPFSWADTNAATLPAQFYRIKVGPPLP